MFIFNKNSIFQLRVGATIFFDCIINFDNLVKTYYTCIMRITCICTAESNLVYRMVSITRTEIEIVTGFLEWGKTTLINNIIKKEFKDTEDKIVILTGEEGIEEIDTLSNENIIVREIENENLNYKYFKNIQREFSPSYIFIEYNGMWNIEDVLNIKFKSEFNVDKIIGTVCPDTFTMYTNNMYEIIGGQLENCDMVYINNYNNMEEETLKSVSSSIRVLNKKCRIIDDEEDKDDYFKDVLGGKDLAGTDKFISIVLGCILFWIVILYLTLLADNGYKDIGKVERFTTIFLSILIESMPFILIGSVISSVMQFFIPDEKMVKLFNKKGASGYFFACILGMAVPICDCGMMIITRRLIRKGVSVPKAVTFLLAAPAVNPIVMLSTYYAFPERPGIVVCRIFFAMLIAVITGVILNALIKDEKVVLNDMTINSCNGYGIQKINYKGTLGKIESVFKHTADEFFYSAKYIIFGAVVSSILQIVVSRSAFVGVKSNLFVQLLIMMGLSFFMSVCANSNAFIGRGFTSVFSIVPVLCFIVMGPMVDIKNLFMMSGTFKESFILRLVLIILAVSFVAFGWFLIWI